MDELIRDLCSVEFRTKSRTRELIEEYTKKIRKEALDQAIKELFPYTQQPMGVSQWREYGKRYKYWEYFEDEIRKETLRDLES